MLKHATRGLLVQLQDGFLVCTLTMHWFIQEKFCSCVFWMFESQGCYSPPPSHSSWDLSCDVPFEEVGLTQPKFWPFLPSGLSFSVIAPQYLAHWYSGASCLFGSLIKYLNRYSLYSSVSWRSSASVGTYSLGSFKHLHSWDMWNTRCTPASSFGNSSL
jgi:hypothetical protein